EMEDLTFCTLPSLTLSSSSFFEESRMCSASILTLARSFALCQILIIILNLCLASNSFSFLLYYVEAFEATNLQVTSTRGERIFNWLSTFEVGSTSTASHAASKLSSRRTANRVE
ncbi:hypothetical protein AABB24_017323, partial [Solanum stoloniferum]